MKKHSFADILMAGGVASGLLFAGTASAIEWNVTGLVRQEIAYSLNSDGNPNNTMDDVFNDRITPNVTHANFGDAAGSAAAIAANPNFFLPGPGLANSRARASADHAAPGVVNIGGQLFAPAGLNTSSPVDCQFSQQRAIASGSAGFGPNIGGFATFPGALCPNGGGSPQAGGNQFAKAGKVPTGDFSLGQNDSMNFNMFNSRVEIDVQAKFNDEFAAYMKARVYYDGTRHFTDGKIGDSFRNPVWSNRRGSLLEVNTPDAMLDLPAFYLDWNRGPLWLRAGNQVIAWGEAYFFRTMDLANGLDLRRHLTLGPGAEEYQDQRIASPGLRMSYTFNNGYELDAFVQMFQPSLLPGQNTAYNLITDDVYLNEQAGFKDARGSLNFGARMTMPFSEQFTGIVGFVNRRNPDGVFRNVDAPTVHQGLINTGCVNKFNDTLNFLNGGNGLQNAAAFGFPTFDKRARTMENGCGSAFAPDTNAATSINYWSNIAAGRIDNANYLRHIINDFPASRWAVRDIFNFGDELTFVDAMRTLEGFRSSFGPFTQWIGREFKREWVAIVGGNYVVESDNELLDQLIIRGEVAVTPNKRLTTDLSWDYKEVTDVVSALILEKYMRFSEAFPATYMVFQWMHRTSTDMFGRDLDKNNMRGIGDFIDAETGAFKPAAFDPEALKPRGSANADYVVFAFQQPFPNLIWRFDMSLLIDTAGGYLVQPGVRYRPSANWQWDLYATMIGSPGGNNDTITETIDFADEMFVRATYFF
ncbi:MAG: DUF1302 family protein [Gammaproteobacteria bacterium]